MEVTESELKRLIEDAGNGDRHAQGKLALMYAAGESVEVSQSKSDGWLREVLKDDDAENLYELGQAFRLRELYVQSAQLFAREVELRDERAILLLAGQYDMGFGVEESREESFRYLLMGAELGN